jgi:DNA polymerase III delta prime subunit
LFIAKRIHRLTLVGPYGTGKSTTAMIALKERIPGINPDCDIFTLNAAEKNPADTMRSVFDALDYVGFNNDGVRCLIIDEADRFSNTADKELKGLLDRVRARKAPIPIILTTNYGGKLDGVLLSRAPEVKWGFAPYEPIVRRVETVLARQGKHLDRKVIDAAIANSNRDLRRLFETELVLASHQS